MNLLAHPTQPRTAAAATRETEIDVHTANELTTKRRVCRRLTSIADEMEDDPSRMSWLRWGDKADVVALLREIAGVTDERVEAVAAEEAADLVNETF